MCHLYDLARHNMPWLEEWLWLCLALSAVEALAGLALWARASEGRWKVSFLPSPKPDREHLERTIAAIRVHRDNHSTWPTWANVLADEVERLWAREEETREALVELKRYAVFHGLLIGECVAWNALKAAYDVETPPGPDAAPESG